MFRQPLWLELALLTDDWLCLCLPEFRLRPRTLTFFFSVSDFTCNYESEVAARGLERLGLLSIVSALVFFPYSR